MNDIDLLLSCQKALWSEVTPGLRSVSAEISGKEILWRCIFESQAAKESEWENLSCAAAEVIAEASLDMMIKEEYLVSDPPAKMEHLKNLVFLRHEKP